ncbi:hypothetical protein ACMA1I_05820 [Pontibacter sp. 13R65]
MKAIITIITVYHKERIADYLLKPEESATESWWSQADARSHF